LVLTTWWALLAAIAIFLVEKDCYARHFEKYAESVPSFLPGISLTTALRGKNL
jgi:hypothetical protein